MQKALPTSINTALAFAVLEAHYADVDAYGQMRIT
jgi:hypothetical protein